jgi:hypothetical protein
MTVSTKRARDFVYSHGVLWERALFAFLFQEGSIERLHQCLICYRNPDGGFGHALEHDIRTPDSHPLALEYILGVFAQHDLPTGELFDSAAQWVEAQQREDGSLRNPPSVLDYPHAPWWDANENNPTMSGGQGAPDSITGLLHRFNKSSSSLLHPTREWVEQNLTLEAIKANEWLFMAYHAYDYFMNVDDFPDVETYRQATIDNIVNGIQKIPEKQYYHLFRFAPTPDSPVAQALPQDVLSRILDYLATTQQDDGGWPDEHGLDQWYPMTTINVLHGLQNFGRL